MAQVQNGSLRLARVFGIDVFVHWTWLVIAYILFESRDQQRYAERAR